MSKLSLMGLDDKDMTPTVWTALVEAFRTVCNGRFPEALLVTEEQAKTFFFANNEIMSKTSPVFRLHPLKNSLMIHATFSGMGSTRLF